MTGSRFSRRTLLKGMAGAAAVTTIRAIPARAATIGAIRLGALVPLTGAGAVWGPKMVEIHKAIITEVNNAGGIGGTQVEYFVEDDQTNPDAGVLAVRKLINADQVCAVMGLWSSAVAAPTLPICWQNHVVMLAIAASDTLATLPHQGYFIRTNVDVGLQGKEIAKFSVAQGATNVFVFLAQTPFSAPMMDGIATELDANGVRSSSLTYDMNKTSFRSEVAQALLQSPDLIVLGGYPQDNIILVKDLYRAGYSGKLVGTGTGITSQFLSGVGKEITEGIYTVQPSPAIKSTAYKKLQQMVGMDVPDSSLCQSYDQVNLALLSIAAAGAATGTAIKDNIRSIGGPEGEPVDNALDGLRLLSAGKAINYEGASGPCEFLPNGNVARANFRTLKVHDGALVDI